VFTRVGDGWTVPIAYSFGMRKPFTVAVLTAASIVASVLAASSADAISSYNSSPAPERTEVGAFFALWDNTGDAVPDRFDWVCSGAMIDDDTFLTAAHCTDDWPAGTTFYVSLEQDVQTPLDEAAAKGLTPTETRDLFLRKKLVVQGDAFQDAAFPGSSSDPHDIGVLDFAARRTNPQDVWDFTPAMLPTAGLFDELGSRTLETLEWTVVGYGLQEALNGPGGQTFPGGGVRLKAPEAFSALNAAWLRLAMNESRDLGGACYGDSGGPNYVELDGQLVLASTTITGDIPCYATNVTYRVDTASARAFLADFVTLP
jgi:Trypsin